MALVAIAAIALIAVGISFLKPKSEKEQNAQKIIEDAIRPEILPSQYDLKNGSDFVHLGFGRIYADHFYLDWRINNTYFMAILGYNGEKPDDFMGYMIYAWVKDPQESGAELARDIFNALPDSGWRRAGPAEQGFANTSISCILWNSSSDRIYLEVVRFRYKEPEIIHMPEEELVQDIAKVEYYCITPLNTNPIYNDLKELQEADLLIWGTGTADH